MKYHLLLDRLVLPSYGSGKIINGISWVIALFLMEYSVNNLLDLAILGEHRFFSTSGLHCLLLKTAFGWSCKYNFSMKKLGLFTFFLSFVMRTLRNYHREFLFGYFYGKYL